MIYCWRYANQPLVWQQLWVWIQSLSVLNKFYEYSLVNSRGFPRTAISRSMIPAGYCLEIPSTFLRYYLSLRESYEVHHLWFTDHQVSSTDISSTMHGGDSRIKLMKPGQDLQTPLLSWSWAWPISASMVLFHWRLGIPNRWSLFDIFWLLNVREEPRVGDDISFSFIAFHFSIWCASWSHDSADNLASRPVYPGYEVWTAWWRHQHIHQWASCQISKIADAHAPGMLGTFSPPSRVIDPDMHHGTCVTHVPWCMPGSLTIGFLWNRRRGKTFPAFPAHAQPAILRIW